MITISSFLSVIAFISCLATPIIGYLVLRKINGTALKMPLTTILIALSFICAAQLIRLLLPFFDPDTISSLRVFHNTVHLVGDVFAIRAVIEIRDYSMVFGFKKGKKSK